MSQRAFIISAATADSHWIRNIGDEALTQGVACALTGAGYDVSATLNGPGSVVAAGPMSLQRRSISRPRDLFAAVGEADLVVVGGGTLLADNEPSTVLPTGLVRLVSATALACRFRKTPLAFLGVGAESWPTGPKRLMLRSAIRSARSTSVRDDDSRQLVGAQTGRPVRLAADTFYGLGMELTASSYLPPANSILVALSGSTDQASVNSVIRLVAEADSPVVVRRMDQHGADDSVAQQVVDRLTAAGVQVFLAPFTNDWQDVYWDCRAASFVVASRLHALIIGSTAQSRMLAVGSNSKVRSFCHFSGISHLADGPVTGSSLSEIARTVDKDYVLTQRTLLANEVRLIAEESSHALVG